MRKIDRYRWILKDDPGRFMWLDKELLRIERAYQRDEIPAKVLRIARSWSWLRCSCITVGLRENDYWVVDGQHRVLAAMRREDLEKLPCLVFATKSLSEEAEGFIGTNVERKPLHIVDRFRAMCVSGDPAALKAAQLLDEAGRKVAKFSGPTSVQCIRLVTNLVKDQHDVLLRVWPMMIELSAGHSFNSIILAALVYIEANGNVSITRPPFRQRVLALGHDGLLKAAHAAAVYFAKGGAKVWALGIVKTLNHRSRSNRITLDG